MGLKTGPVETDIIFDHSMNERSTETSGWASGAMRGGPQNAPPHHLRRMKHKLCD